MSVAASTALVLALLASQRSVARGGGIEVVHPEGAAAEAEDLARLVPDLRVEVSDRLGLALPEEMTVTLVRDREALAAEFGPDIEGWAAGVTFPASRTVAIRLDAVAPYAAATLRDVFRHEIVHLAMATLPARPPRWFEEGVAQWFAGRVILGQPADLELALGLKSLLPFSGLEDRFPSREDEAALAYLESESIVSHLVRRFGPVGLRDVIGQFARLGDLKRAIEAALGIALVDLEVSWRKDLEERGTLLFLVFRTVPLFALVALVVVIGFWRARARRKRTLERFDAEASGEAHGREDPGEDRLGLF